MVSTKSIIIRIASFTINQFSRPSLFDDFVEYELDRLKKLELQEQQQDEDDSNNNIKFTPHGEQFNSSSSNTLQANWLWS